MIPRAPDDHCRPLIVPIFIPHAGCPHRCAFCDQNAITGSSVLPTPDVITDTIRQWRSHSRHRGRPLQIAFYGGNFLGLPKEAVTSMLDAATAATTAHVLSGIRFSTRPDTITASRLAMLEEYPIRMIEVGVQSLNDRVLSASRRGHDARSAKAAIQCLIAAGHDFGIQLMVGLPEDTAAAAMATARQVAAMRPGAVRIYPTLVLRHSALAEWTLRGKYRPWSLTSAVEVVAAMVRVFAQKDIPVIRMGLQDDDGLRDDGAVLAGPYHPAFGHLVHSRLFRDALDGELMHRRPLPGIVEVGVHPRSRSRIGGWRNATLMDLERRFAVSLQITPDPGIGVEQLWVDHHPPVSVFSG